MNDLDLQLLERHLDGQLDQAELRELETRLIAEPQLRRQLDELRGQRALREGFFSSLEGDEAPVDRLLRRVERAIARRQRLVAGMRVARWALAAAACIALGFAGGRMLRNSEPRPTVLSETVETGSSAFFDVAITDDTGAVIGVQKFNSLEQARQFSQDLDTWQDRLDRLRTGQVIVRSASF